MNEQTKTNDKKYTCLECKNENTVSDAKLGDVIECEYCGIEYEVVEVLENEYTLKLLEEEK